MTGPGSSQTLYANDPIKLESLINIPDSLRQAGFQVEYYANGQLIGQGTSQTPDQYPLNWSPANAGQYLVKAVLKDAQGQLVAESATDTLNVTYRSSGGSGGGGSSSAAVLTASIVTPVNGALVNNLSQALQGTVNNYPPNSSVTFVVKDQNGAPVANLPATNTGGTNWQTNWTPTQTGNYTVELQVRNQAGDLLITDTKPVPVVETTVTLNGPADNSIFKTTDTVPLTGTVTNVPAGGSVRYRIVERDALGNLTTVHTIPNVQGTGNTYTANWTPTTQGGGNNKDYFVVLEVLDSADNQFKKDENNLALINTPVTMSVTTPDPTGRIGPIAPASITATPNLTPLLTQNFAALGVNLQVTTDVNQSVPLTTNNNGNTWTGTYTPSNNLSPGSINHSLTGTLTVNGTPVANNSQTLSMSRCALNSAVTLIANHSFELYNSADGSAGGNPVSFYFLNTLPCWNSAPGTLFEIDNNLIWPSMWVGPVANNAPIKPDGVNIIDMNANSPSDFNQDIPTVVGQTYTLNFTYEGHGSGTRTLEVYWNGVLADTLTYTATSAVDWQIRILNLPAATSATTNLRFRSTTSGTQGMVIDNLILKTP